MFRTDFNGGTWHKCLVPLCLTVLLSIFGVESYANNIDSSPQDAIACNNQVNVTLHEENCNALITPDMVLEGDMDAAYDYYVTAQGPFDPDSNDEGSLYEGTVANPDVLISMKGDYKVTITQVDGTGNENWCWGNLKVEDKAGPEIENDDCDCTEADPCRVEFFCDFLSDDPFINHLYGVGAPYAHDNCSGYDVQVSFKIANGYSLDGGAMCDERIVKGNWSYYDDCGNETLSCDYWYVVAPLTVPTDPLVSTDPFYLPVKEVVVPCGHGFTPDDIYNYFYQHHYDYLVADYIEYLVDMGDHDATIDDIPADDLDYIAHYAEYYGLEYAYPSLYGQALKEGTYCNVAVTFDDEVVPVCGSTCDRSDKIIRTWKIYNWCVAGEILEFVQIIDAHDSEPPHVSAQNLTLSVDPWGCFGDFYMPEPQIHDDCSDFTSYTVTGPVGASIEFEAGKGWHITNAPKGAHTYYINGFDCCDNVNAFPITVTIVDNTQPIAIAKQDLVISLVNIDETSDGGTGVAKLYATSVDNDSYDGCGDVHLEIRRDSDYCSREGNMTFNNDEDHSFDDEDDTQDGGLYVTFCCSDIADHGVDENGDGINDYAILKVWLRVWDDGDMDGVWGSAGDNYNEAWSFVRVEDKAQPDILCPADLSVQCYSDAFDFDLVGEGLALNSCGSAVAVFTDTKEELNDCNAGVIKRKWYVENFPQINCTQEITVMPADTDDVDIWYPESYTTDCTDDLTGQEPTWTTNSPCDLMAWSVEVDTFYLEEGACYKIRKTWKVINWCGLDENGNVYEYPNHEQIIKVIDEDKPYFLSCEDVTFAADDYDDADSDGLICENNSVMLTAVADDSGTCPSPWIKWNIEVDLEGNGWVDYVFSSSLLSNDPLYVEPTLAGDQVKITLPDGVRGSMFSHTVKWSAIDGCGNAAICNTSFMVVDQKPPTPYCVNLSTALMENGQVELWACDFDLGSFDNCTPRSDLRFTFTSTPPSEDGNFNEDTNCSARVFTCDDFAVQPVQITLYVWDEKDNYDFCSVQMTLVDNQGNCAGGTGSKADISGEVRREDGSKVEDAMVQITSALPEYPQDDMTDTDGIYAFDENVMYVDYELGGVKNDDYLNGVSTLDLVLIQRHVLGIQYLDSPYKLIAADVNSDENISSIDLIELRKLILGINSELPNNDSWRFVPASESLDPSNPWPFTEFIEIDDLDNNMMNEDFIGVKIGDVNLTATVNVFEQGSSSRNSNKLTIYTNDQDVSAGNEFALSFNAQEFNEVFGFQFTLDLDKVSLVGFESGAIELSDNNIGILDNSLTMSWNNMDGVSTSEELFTLKFLADANVNVAEAVSLNSRITKAEAYLGEQLEIVDLEMRTGDKGAFKLYQNVPNPFSESTIIGFELPTEGNASLTIYDVTGKVINVSNGYYNAGYNEIEITTEAINQTGILYYELTSGNQVMTKKMISIK